MTTENGIPHLKAYRGAIHTLSRRRDYLEDRLVTMRTTGATQEVMDWVEAELAALGYAIPCLEAEWDSMARLKREVIRNGEPTRVDPVSPQEYAPGSPRQTPPQGDTHGRTPH